VIAVPVTLLVLVCFFAIRWGAAEWERRGEAGPAFVAAAGACAVIAVVQSLALGWAVAGEQPELGGSRIVLGLLFMVCLPAWGAAVGVSRHGVGGVLGAGPVLILAVIAMAFADVGEWISALASMGVALGLVAVVLNLIAFTRARRGRVATGLTVSWYWASWLGTLATAVGVALLLGAAIGAM